MRYLHAVELEILRRVMYFSQPENRPHNLYPRILVFRQVAAYIGLITYVLNILRQRVKLFSCVSVMVVEHCLMQEKSFIRSDFTQSGL